MSRVFVNEEAIEGTIFWFDCVVSLYDRLTCFRSACTKPDGRDRVKLFLYDNYTVWIFRISAFQQPNATMLRCNKRKYCDCEECWFLESLYILWKFCRTFYKDSLFGLNYAGLLQDPRYFLFFFVRTCSAFTIRRGLKSLLCLLYSY